MHQFLKNFPGEHAPGPPRFALCLCCSPSWLDRAVSLILFFKLNMSASSSLDLVVTMSCSLTLQICLIIPLQTLKVWLCQWPSLAGMEHCTPHTRAVHTATCFLKERWREERTGSRSLNFFQAVFTRVVVESSQPPAESKRKLPPQACQVRPGLPSVVCHSRGVQLPGNVYICSQGLFSSAWAHCISCAPSACSHCRRCCCCPFQCDKQRMETRLNSAGGPVPYLRSWSLSFLHLLSDLYSPLLLSMSRASWHISQAIQWW